MNHFAATALGFLVACQAATADVRYTYTGPAVGANAIPFFAPTDHVTGYFEMATQPTSGDFAAQDLLAAEFWLGPLTISLATGADVGAHLEFDILGNITHWSFVIGRYGPPGPEPALVELWLNGPDYNPDGDRLTAHIDGRTQLAATTPHGTWVRSASTAPAPGTVALLAAALLALALTAPCRHRAW